VAPVTAAFILPQGATIPAGATITSKAQPWRGQTTGMKFISYNPTVSSGGKLCGIQVLAVVG